MKLVIEIPEEVKNRLCFGVTYTEDIQVVCEALNDGTPLPEGHGRLIDADKLKEYYFRPYSNEEVYSNTDNEHIIDNAPTIIEADKEKEE